MIFDRWAESYIWSLIFNLRRLFERKGTSPDVCWGELTTTNCDFFLCDLTLSCAALQYSPEPKWYSYQIQRFWWSENSNQYRQYFFILTSTFVSKIPLHPSKTDLLRTLREKPVKNVMGHKNFSSNTDSMEHYGFQRWKIGWELGRNIQKLILPQQRKASVSVDCEKCHLFCWIS